MAGLAVDCMAAWQYGGMAVWRFGGLAVWRFGGMIVWQSQELTGIWRKKRKEEKGTEDVASGRFMID